MDVQRGCAVTGRSSEIWDEWRNTNGISEVAVPAIPVTDAGISRVVKSKRGVQSDIRPGVHGLIGPDKPVLHRIFQMTVGLVIIADIDISIPT